MSRTRRSAPALLGKDIFRSGRYLRYFNPDDPRNPFFHLYERKRRDVADLILQSQGPGRILDIGGGGGRLVRALDEPAQARTVLADISEDMLQLAKKTGGKKNGARLVSADAHRLPFRDRSFDMVVGLDLLCHLEEPATALWEFHRVLTDRGILILDSSNSNPLWTFFYPRYLGRNPLNWLRIISAGGVSPGWRLIVKHYPKKTFFSFLERAGFEITRRIAYGPVVCPKWHLAVSRKKDQAG
jgi:glycogen(starch) synthase